MSGTAAALPSGLRRCLAGYLGGNWERRVRGQVGGRRLGGVPDDRAVDVDAVSAVRGGLTGGRVDTGQQVVPGGGQVEHDVLVDLPLVQPCGDRLGGPQAQLRVPQRAIGVGVPGIGQGREVTEHLEEVAAKAQGVDQGGIASRGVLCGEPAIAITGNVMVLRTGIPPVGMPGQPGHHTYLVPRWIRAATACLLTSHLLDSSRISRRRSPWAADNPARATRPLGMPRRQRLNVKRWWLLNGLVPSTRQPAMERQRRCPSRRRVSPAGAPPGSPAFCKMAAIGAAVGALDPLTAPAAGWPKAVASGRRPSYGPAARRARWVC